MQNERKSKDQIVGFETGALKMEDTIYKSKARSYCFIGGSYDPSRLVQLISSKNAKCFHEYNTIQYNIKLITRHM